MPSDSHLFWVSQVEGHSGQHAFPYTKRRHLVLRVNRKNSTRFPEDGPPDQSNYNRSSLLFFEKERHKIRLNVPVLIDWLHLWMLLTKAVLFVCRRCPQKKRLGYDSYSTAPVLRPLCGQRPRLDPVHSGKKVAWFLNVLVVGHPKAKK